MKEVSAAGFGSLKEEQKSKCLRKVLTYLLKRSYGELRDAQLATLKRQ